MAFSKKFRENVYRKYNGHCAYCGCRLEYKDMQVDHIESRYRAEYRGKEVDNSIDNLNPSCRACNFYKGDKTIERFRKDITDTLLPNLKKNFNFRLAKKYNFILENDIDSITFYYEEQESRQ